MPDTPPPKPILSEDQVRRLLNSADKIDDVHKCLLDPTTGVCVRVDRAEHRIGNIEEQANDLRDRSHDHANKLLSIMHFVEERRKDVDRRDAWLRVIFATGLGGFITSLIALWRSSNS